MKFKDLQLDERLVKTLDELGFEEPTPIQQKAIPVALEGRDLIGQAQTGTGKTAAFGLPLLNKLETNHDNIQSLVVAPTRELAIQVQEELFRLGKGVRSRIYVVYGGSPIGKQIERIKRNKPQVIVGTPGRLLDLINRKVLKLEHVQTLVLDEADEMLNMGFIEDIKSIVSKTPQARQTLLFSATMPPAIRNLADQFLKSPAHVHIETKHVTADLIEQFYAKCRDDEKFDALSRFLDVQMPKQAIIFCRTKKRVDEVGRGLNLRGYNAEVIHGDITQQKRSSVINAFKKGNVELLVATDVAARGLDITGVTHVYNYDITQDPESYVHRIGRTGRAGNEGLSLTFVLPTEMPYLRTIEKLVGKQMQPMKPPTIQEAQQGQIHQIIEQINEQLEGDQVNHSRQNAKLLLANYEAEDLVAALLGQIVSESREIAVSISPQKPLPNADRKKRNNRDNYRKKSGKSNRNKYSGGNKGNYSKSNKKNFKMKKKER
ncbi:DEAD/DEAH box helicase [Facklamia sp. P12945]|uniref:DEAD/DEAH box helicase n=1 Tax=unclassified Facklamia TaxID=2622293 RepID=UPI003D17C583